MNIIWSDDAFAVVTHAIDIADATRLRAFREQLDAVRDYLSNEPGTQGESREGNVRIGFVGVFQLLFEVRAIDTDVVLKARIDERRWEKHDEAVQ